jgi:hypothetical protein
MIGSDGGNTRQRKRRSQKRKLRKNIDKLSRTKKKAAPSRLRQDKRISSECGEDSEEKKRHFEESSSGTTVERAVLTS